MNGSIAANERWLQVARGAQAPLACTVVVCPPTAYLTQVRSGLEGTAFAVGAQNVCDKPAGAWTGETCTDMLVDLGVTWVIIGHSERRAHFGETDAIVAAKAAAVVRAGLKPIVCVGETLVQREQGQTLNVVNAQIDALLEGCGAAALATGAIAYEPIWAIGTGKTATPIQAQEVHAAIRARMRIADADVAARLPVLYGGSVKPSNASELFNQPDIDGGLIGGASLLAEDFLAICAAARA
jgi:triosephosphate isomerase